MAECLQPWKWDPAYRQHDGTGGVAETIEGMRCHVCAPCRAVRRGATGGRCMAQLHASLGATFITCTYGKDDRYKGTALAHTDHPHAGGLEHYEDVQKYFKRLRNDGFEFSYLSVGELGSAKGRAHWHNLFFWRNKIPDYRDGYTFDDAYWHEGIVDYGEVNLASVDYVCQYILPDEGVISHVARSTKPPLGDVYFHELAAQHVREGLSPQTPMYTIPGVYTNHGARRGPPREFVLVEQARDRYCDSYLNQLSEARPGTKYPASEFLDEHVDRAFRRKVERDVRQQARDTAKDSRRWLEVWNFSKTVSYLTAPRDIPAPWPKPTAQARNDHQGRVVVQARKGPTIIAPTKRKGEEFRIGKMADEVLLTREQRLEPVLFQRRLLPDRHPLTSPVRSAARKPENEFGEVDLSKYTIVRSI